MPHRESKKPTAKDVARLAGVSQATVSMILNNYSNVSFTEETRQKVYDACLQLGYKGINTHNSNNERILLLVCPSTENLFYAKQVETAHQTALSYDYTCLVLNTFRKSKIENQIIHLLNTLPIAGVVFLYQPENLRLLEQAAKLKNCVVVCDRNLDIHLDTVETNSFKLGELVSNHMLELGHKNVVYISTNVNSKYITRKKRLEGIKETYALSGLDPDESVKVCTFETECIHERGIISEYKAGLVLARRALQRYGSSITGFIGNNDTICYGIIEALQERKLRIPHDYSVVGFDNLPLSASTNVSLTSVEHFADLRSRDAVILVISKIDSSVDRDIENEMASSVTRVEYEPKLIIRSSTGAPASK